jgi:glycosyltransferase involved in cell wall biosynthesis
MSAAIRPATDDSWAPSRPVLEGRDAAPPKAIWISWERHRRTRELSRALGTELFELTSRFPRVLRYVALLARTAVCVARQRPSILVVQCPSLVLGLGAGILKPLFRFTLVADLHTEAVRPYVFSSPVYAFLFGLVRRAADACLVTNASQKRIVEGGGGRAFVLPDKVPDLVRMGPPRSPRPGAQAVFICTYAPDEPFLEVLEAARALHPLVTIHVTGNHRGVGESLPASPAHLTGFLPEEEYVELLGAADVIIDLTRMEDCLVCGAYEAVALGKPLVTSDTSALRSYFRMGTVYTRHDAPSLAASIIYALAHKDTLAAEMKTLKFELARDWKMQKDEVRRALHLGSLDR